MKKIAFILLFSQLAFAGNRIYYKTNLTRIIPKSNRSQLAYLGGPVISNVKIISVMWGSSVDKTVSGQVGGFYSTIVNSSYMDWLSEYNTNITATNGHQGTNQTIGRGTFSGVYTITPSTGNATAVDDSAIQSELAAQIAAGHLPANSDDTLYMVSFPAGVTISLTFGGSTAYSCQEFCAYHNSGHAGSGNLYYGVLPDFSGACSSGCGNNDMFSNYTAAASHEITEAITDPQVGDTPGNTVDYPMAWYDSAGGEIGDICVGTTASLPGSNGSNYTVQGEWSNKQNACVSTAHGL